jgi:hypothetical protein
MLDLQNEAARFHGIDAITLLKCEIELPESLGEFFDHSGLTGAHAYERRQFPRWKNRTRAGLFYNETFPVIPRERQCHAVYLNDVSRGGARFLHSEELYPLEQMHLLFIDSVSSRLMSNDFLRVIEVLRCARVAAKCYEVGVRFIPVQSSRC